jgi:ribosomal protein S18 acetylase RimI-like enzyme
MVSLHYTRTWWKPITQEQHQAIKLMTLTSLLSFIIGGGGPSLSLNNYAPLCSPNLSRLGSTSTSYSDADNTNNRRDFYIEKVTTKARALDVRVFRGFSMSAAEYVLDQQQSGTEMSESMAINLLMKDYNDQGHYVVKDTIIKNKNKPQIIIEPAHYFVAISNVTDMSSCDLDIARHNGLVAVVSAQLRHHSPLMMTSPCSNDDGIHHALDVSIPLSHLYIANMRVGDSMQRRGIGMSLLSSIKDYANALGKENNIPLVLSVDNNNLNAIQLYEKFGFQFLERNSDFGTMIYNIKTEGIL